MRALTISCAVVLAGCGGDVAPDVDPLAGCADARACESVPAGATDEVDLLFVVDESQLPQLSAGVGALQRVVTALATGDLDGDGAAEARPVGSLHVGIVTTDLGAAGHAFPTCEGRGDDGVLVTRGSATDPACDAAYPAVLEYGSGAALEPFVADVACVAGVGTDGCGIEQPLEAALKALSPAAPQPWTVDGYEPPVFFGGSRGHGEGANAGFLRPTSALAVLVFENEDDCSVADADLLDMASTRYTSGLSMRCGAHPEALHDWFRYARGLDGRSGLVGLRRDPGRVALAVIAGVPPDAIPDPTAIDYDAILAHPDMSTPIDPATGRPRIACEVEGVGGAFPPIRLVETAREIGISGGHATVQSICATDLAPASAAIASTIAAARGGCWGGARFEPDAGGRIACELYELLADATAECPTGTTDAGTSEHGGASRRACLVPQRAGWTYEEGPPECPGGSRVSLDGLAAAEGVELVLACD